MCVCVSASVCAGGGPAGCFAMRQGQMVTSGEAGWACLPAPLWVTSASFSAHPWNGSSLRAKKQGFYAPPPPPNPPPPHCLYRDSFAANVIFGGVRFDSQLKPVAP